MKVFYLGTAVKIITVLSDDIPDSDSVTITIKDSSASAKVTDTAMTRTQDNVWTYTYQTASTDNEGTWSAAIKATSGSYTSVNEVYFELRIQT